MIVIDFDAPVDTRKALGVAAAVLVLFVGLIVRVFATGSTFDQRCAEENPHGTPGWTACVHRLARG